MLSPGTLLQQRYQINHLLGAGGFGAVYCAQDRRLQHLVAVKENERGDLHQFEQEALILARLHHPNLPRVIDHFTEPNGAQYLVMDYIEGLSLYDYLGQHGPLSHDQALAMCREVLSALNYLHGQTPPIIHRDLKPSNIIIKSDQHITLVDFGLAKRHQQGQPTSPGALAVSHGFAAPEQYLGQGSTDQRTDIYALGATLYMALTGQEVPSAQTLLAGSAMLVPPTRIKTEIDRATERVILKAMALDPKQRFQNAAEMQEALDHLQRQGVPRLEQSIAVSLKRLWGLLGTTEQRKHTVSRSAPTMYPVDVPPPTPLPRTGSFTFQYAAATHPGRQKRLNEDSFITGNLNIPNLLATRGELLIVADGGGSPGDLASSIAVSTIFEHYYQAQGDPHTALRHAIESANRELYQYARQQKLDLHTTVVASAYVGDYLYVAHVGNSRAYRIRNGESIVQLTKDHTVVASQVEAGKLTPDEAARHPWRHTLTHALGAMPQVEVEISKFSAIRALPGDVIVLCSDGLTEHVPPHRIIELTTQGTPQQAARALINEANANGGSDNIAVVVGYVRD